MENEEILSKKIEEVLPNQKPKDDRDFFERNKKLIIILMAALLVLWIAVNIYLEVSFKKIDELIGILP